jgi:oxygen-dependent protoporphyrinogen oxidase
MLMAPSRLWPMLTTPLLSVRGKARLLAEFLIPPLRKAEDQTLAGFARRRFGREVFERLIQPLIGGIYTADPERLSLAATLPRFLELERHFGSLLAAAREGAMRTSADEDAATSGARYGMFVAPRDGMDQWIARLAARLPAGSVRLNSPVASVGRESDDRWTVALESGERIAADAVIVAVPARAAARLLAGETGLAENLQKIPYASTAIVSLGFRRADVRQPLDAFGFVAPACERRRILAASFSSVKYPGRAPDDALLARVFIGGACQAELLEQDDAGLIRLAIEELSALLEITAPPIMTHLTRWPTTMPQYHLGHLSLVEALEAQVAKLPGLALAGASYRGVGIPHCVRSGETAAAAALGASRVA